MNHQQQRVVRNRDPFTTKPLPRSFYHPSPKKYVKNVKQAIEAPQHPEDTQFTENVEHNLIQMQIPLHDECSIVPKPTKREPTADETDGFFDETWPSSARLSSPRDTSHYTVASDANASGEYNLSEAIQGLEVYDRNKYGAMKDTEKHGRDGEASSSTLQKYIERFRNSEPKPRELRMRERQVDHQEFWWLRPEHDSKPASGSPYPVQSEKEGKITNTDNRMGEKDSHTGVKLTREALLAMDEATLQLQTKAESLLCKSEMSMLSSGPIVSTVGLGSSFCGSDCSTVVNSANQTLASSLFKESRLHYEKVALNEMRKNVEEPCKDNNGDVLARWRLRRKMETGESHLSSKTQNHSSLAHSNNLPKSSMNQELDARLEDFRKRLLSQRLPITPEDIQYERQKMDILMGNSEKEKSEPALSAPQQDPVLERLRSITRNASLPQNVPPLTKVGDDNGHEFSLKTINVNVNNSTLPHVHNQAFDLEQNKNNTAVGGDDCIGDMAGVIVDNLGEPVVTDPKQKVFILSPRDPQTMNSQATPKEEEECSFEIGNKNTSQHCLPGQDRVPSKGQPLRDLSLNHMPATGVEKPYKSKAKLDDRSEERIHANEMQAKVVEGQIYHQFLEAEKPSSDDVSAFKTDKSKRSSYVDLSEPINVGAVSQGDNEKTSEATIRTVNSKSGVVESHKHRSRQKVRPKASQNKTSKQSSQDYEGSESLSDDVSLDFCKSEDSYRNKPVPEVSTLHEKMTVSAKGMKTCKDSLPVVASEDRDTAGKEYAKGHVKKFTVHQKASPPQSAPRRGSQTHKYSESRSPGQPVRGAIGQVVTEHLFDSSVVLSSVDSWASAFPPSPSPKHSNSSSEPYEARTSSTPSRDGDSQENNMGSVPVLHQNIAHENLALGKLLGQTSGDDELYHSDDEFTDDPLLNLLRAQRTKYIAKLELIEQQLQDLDPSHSEL